MFNVCLSGGDRPGELVHWSYVLSHFSYDRVYLLGGPDHLDANDYHLKTAKRVKTAAQLPKKTPLVLFSPANARYLPGQVSLLDFTHPKNATYMFGSNCVHLSEDELGGRDPDHVVYIPTADHHECFDFVAASIALWDRTIRHG